MKICVIYDTKRKNGATVHIVKWIQEALTDVKAEVDLRSWDKVDDFDYDLFIVGSPIYWERPLKSVLNFLSENRAKLADKKVVIFIVCMANLFGHFTDEYIDKRYLKPLEENISDSVVEKAVFRGWLKKPNHNERRKVIKWARELIEMELRSNGQRR